MSDTENPSARLAQDEDDVEGPLRPSARLAQDEDDVEGHLRPSRRAEAHDDDDTAGHLMSGALSSDDTTPGLRRDL